MVKKKSWKEKKQTRYSLILGILLTAKCNKVAAWIPSEIFVHVNIFDSLFYILQSTQNRNITKEIKEK